MYVSMYVCMYVIMYVCMYVCMYICMYVCMYACMNVCMIQELIIKERDYFTTLTTRLSVLGMRRVEIKVFERV